MSELTAGTRLLVPVLYFDRPGIGESDISEYYLMETYLKSIYDILRKHQVSSVNVIGHSAGGYYAQVFASLYPDFVETLSLVSSRDYTELREYNKGV